MKTAAKVVAAVAVAHVIVIGGVASVLQGMADEAMRPVVKAAPIVVQAKAPAIVKAERIEIRASALAANNMPAPTYALLRTPRDLV